jgi:hypothetical protein
VINRRMVVDVAHPGGAKHQRTAIQMGSNFTAWVAARHVSSATMFLLGPSGYSEFSDPTRVCLKGVWIARRFPQKLRDRQKNL